MPIAANAKARRGVAEPPDDSVNTELEAIQQSRFGWLYGKFARLLSFTLAVGLYASLFLSPHSLGNTASEVNHGLLTLMLLGSSASFVHASGLVPRARLWRILFSPVLAWPLIILGLLRVWQA